MDESEDGDAYMRELLRRGGMLEWRNVGGGMDEGEGEEYDEDDDVEFGDADEDAYIEAIEDIIWGSDGEEEDEDEEGELDGDLEDMDELD